MTTTHSPHALTVAIASTGTTAAVAEPIDVAAVYAAHGEFVWASLQRLGVQPSDLHDVLQEVFIVVQQRLRSFEGHSTMRTWLFGISIRVVAAYRRRAYRRREQPTAEFAERVAPPIDDPEVAAMREQARERLSAILDELDLERRAVFVMFEIDEMSCEEIASALCVPIGTVYSRLHRARKDVERVAARWLARDAHGGPR